MKKIFNAKVIKAGDLHENPAAAKVLQKLRSYLDVASPELVHFLVNLWNAQGRAITYKELREAILAGEISADLLDEWRQDYSKFIVDHLQPAWEAAMRAAVTKWEEKYPDWYFDPMGDGVRDWTAKHSAELVTNSTQAQIDGLRAVVRQATVAEVMSVDQLARAIRPLVGLTRPQAVANMNYYNTLIDNGIKPEKALDLSTRYAARQHRWRAWNIARTETAKAYNTGAHQGIKQAQAKGYLLEMVKQWSTSLTERRCPRCKALEGKIVGVDEEFAPGVLCPPLHSSCMCAVMYKERIDVIE